MFHTVVLDDLLLKMVSDSFFNVAQMWSIGLISHD